MNAYEKLEEMVAAQADKKGLNEDEWKLLFNQTIPYETYEIEPKKEG